MTYLINLPLTDADVHVLLLTRDNVLAILKIIQRFKHSIVHLLHMESLILYEK